MLNKGKIEIAPELSLQPDSLVMFSEAEPVNIGMSFDLRIERPVPPIGLDIIKRVFEFHPFTASTPEEVLAEIVSLTNNGKTQHEFYKWMAWQGGYPRRWAEMLFVTVSLATYSSAQKEQNLAVVSVFPYWELSCMTRYCVSHSRLDGLIRKWNDPVWEDIYPPNGWACGCSVISCLPTDRYYAPHVRVTAKIRAQCRDWIRSDPRPVRDLF